MYDLNSNNPNPVINYDGVSKNITSVGFHEDGRWMYTGGEDCMARIWDLRYYKGSLLRWNTFPLWSAKLTLIPTAPPRSRNLQCQRIFQVNAPINCVCLHPNQVRQCYCKSVRVFASRSNMSINSQCCMFFRRSWLLETRVEWFISGIWRLITMNSWVLSQRSR